MTAQVVQLVGAALVLGAYVLAQARRLADDSVPYLLANAVGAGVLAVLALVGRDWGFLLLEGSWSLVSLAGLVRRWASVRDDLGRRVGFAEVAERDRLRDLRRGRRALRSVAEPRWPEPRVVADVHESQLPTLPTRLPGADCPLCAEIAADRSAWFEETR